MIRFSNVVKAIRSGSYYLSKHADRERQNDGLFLEEIKEALLTGRIIEKYNDTGRGESCLVAGFTKTGKPIHAVIGLQGSIAVIITVYIPSPPKFITPFERVKK